MNSTYSVNHKKVAVHLCHNTGKSGSIFKIFALKQENMVTTATTGPLCGGHLHYTACLPVCKEQGAEKKVMNRTARAWYKRYACSAKLDRIVDHNEGPKSTGTAKSTGAIFPFPLWVRRLWLALKGLNSFGNIHVSTDGLNNNHNNK